MNQYRTGYTAFSLYSLPVVRNNRIALSVHGGAGGRNVRVSNAAKGLGSGFDLTQGLAGDGGNIFVSGNEKMAMQNLNDRLAAYLEKVHSLETSNAKLELQIREWYEQKTLTVRDYSKYEKITEDLRTKIVLATQDNTGLMLQIDNARLAAEDFRIKLENEMAVRLSVESDIAGLRKVLDDLTMYRSDLEMQVEGLKEDLVHLKKNHKEELAAMRGQFSNRSVNVEVDSKPQDLNKTLEEIRIQYEGIIDKNRREMEAWYKVKFDELSKHVASSTETLQSSKSEINELRRSLQALQIEQQSQISLKSALEGQLLETETLYSVKLSQIQVLVDGLQKELSEVKADIARQSMEYQLLLDIKTRLELEIAEYRRLLDGEADTKTVQVPDVKDRKPVVTQRTKVVIEEIVDGKVVSRTEDVDTEVISN